MTCSPATSHQKGFIAKRFPPSHSAARPATVRVPGGTGLIGTAKPYIRADAEAPVREGRVDTFFMSQGAITNADFAQFVSDTGYVTEAEFYGWSFVFWSQLSDPSTQNQPVPGASWWHKVDGAYWRCIAGPSCQLVEERAAHPVVHVSWNDAMAYCSWIGGRLPTELEWEYAARGGLGDVRFPWGDGEPDDEQYHPCNIWQGQFPRTNTAKDGYSATAPVVSYSPNGYGLYNLVGNVWEWTADNFTQLKAKSALSIDQDDSIVVSKGGSFLCHRSYCYRYRIAARIASNKDTTTTHMGFRVVWND